MFKRNQVERGAAFFQKQGPALVFATRFVPGTRLPTYFASGMFRAPFLKFAGWFLLAAAVWTPLLVGMACGIGGPLLGWFERFETYALLGLVAVVLILWAMLKLVVSSRCLVYILNTFCIRLPRHGGRRSLRC